MFMFSDSKLRSQHTSDFISIETHFLMVYSWRPQSFNRILSDYSTSKQKKMEALNPPFFYKIFNTQDFVVLVFPQESMHVHLSGWHRGKPVELGVDCVFPEYSVQLSC